MVSHVAALAAAVCPGARPIRDTRAATQACHVAALAEAMTDELQPEAQIEVQGHVDALAPVLASGQTLHRRYTVTVEDGVEYVDDIEEWVETDVTT